jgi:hypothetical protein
MVWQSKKNIKRDIHHNAWQQTKAILGQSHISYHNYFTIYSDFYVRFTNISKSGWWINNFFRMAFQLEPL